MRVFVLVALAWLLAAVPARGQASAGAEKQFDYGDPALPETSADAPLRTVNAVRLAGRPPDLDGRLEDEVWRQASFVSGFDRTRPGDQTEIGVLYDDRFLYIGARMASTTPRAIQALVGRRDRTGSSESLVVSLDTYRDRRTAHSFEITAGGVRLDYVHPEDSYWERDYTWDPVWEGRAARASSGWTAELRIPFSQLRFHQGGGQVWGVNFVRKIPIRNQLSAWIPLRRRQTGWSSRFGELAGLTGVEPARGVELLPYAAAETVFEDPELSNPVASASDVSARAGADLRALLGPLVLDATVNPDFGQVEADPAEVNLTAFETSFSERRPFFLQSNEQFNAGGPEYFYSRRIGVAPRGPAKADFVVRPDRTTIYGASRISGRLESNVGLTALAAVTSREEARTFDASTGNFGSVEVEPRTLFAAARIEGAAGAPASTTGATFTYVERHLGDDDPLAGLLSRRAFAGGGDFALRVPDAPYELSGHLGASYVAGDSAAIARLQRSSARYYQRPDTRYVEFDPLRRALSGYTGGFAVKRIEGDWRWKVGGSAISPGFEINDAGIQRLADRLQVEGSLGLGGDVEGTIMRRYDVDLYGSESWNYGGERQYASPGVAASFLWANYWSTWFDAWTELPAVSDKLTRGGPLMETPVAWNGRLGFSSDYGATMQWYGEAWLRKDERGFSNLSISGSVTLLGGARWRMTLTPGMSRDLDRRQFFTAIQGGALGTRWIFSTVDHRTWYTRVRLDYAVSPEMTIELHAEPFSSIGEFSGFGELVDPPSDDLRVYGTDGTTIERETDGSWTVQTTTARFSLDDQDFDARSFRSTLVGRWEWRRGSTFYLVWQHDRYDDAIGPGTARSMLLAKATYWLPVD